MGQSDAALNEMAGQSISADDREALRDALTSAFKALFAAGHTPQDILSITWEVDDVARFHPSRHNVDLVYREVFGGFRKPVTMRHVDRPGVRVVIMAKVMPHSESDKRIYRDYTLAELARQYSPRNQTDMNVLLKQCSIDGEKARARHGGLDLCYGPARYETFDLFMPVTVSRPPLWIFLHGGYWQATDKNQHAQFATGMLDAGYAVAMPNYGLAPETSLADIVKQVDRLLSFLVREAGNLGIDGSQLHLAGHSAGAHLAAMALTNSAVPVRSALLLSGLFDLEPLGLLPIGALMKFDAATIDAMSPVRKPAPFARIALAVGANESDEFKRQSELLASAWHSPAPLIAQGNHFSLLDGLKGGALLDLARSLVAQSH